MGTVNWKEVVQDRDGGKQLGRCLSFLVSGAKEEEEGGGGGGYYSND
jgi:hypothetical protein